MIILISAVIIFIISLLLAIKSVASEFSAPAEVKGIKISGKKKLSGVILFLKKKIIHYTSG
ncbi:hypothetical protein FJY90_07335 [Candidatus Gottesmanbacteria bacterium]|nr:hypothetical protein [Candidatus Gottesmanbacteria bacterium]